MKRLALALPLLCLACFALADDAPPHFKLGADGTPDPYDQPPRWFKEPHEVTVTIHVDAGGTYHEGTGTFDQIAQMLDTKLDMIQLHMIDPVPRSVLGKNVTALCEEVQTLKPDADIGPWSIGVRCVLKS